MPVCAALTYIFMHNLWNIFFFNELNFSVVDNFWRFIGSLTTYFWNLRKYLQDFVMSPSIVEQTHIKWEYIWGSQFSHILCIGRM